MRYRSRAGGPIRSVYFRDPDGNLVEVAEPGVLSELTELAGLETECCAFAAWNVAEDGGTIVLEVVTQRSNAPVVWAMFDESPPVGESSDG